MSYSSSLGRWIQTDPEQYTDGLNLYQYERGSPATFVDPIGTASVNLSIDTGSPNLTEPWVGAPWTIYRGAPGDRGNPGLVRVGLISVKCTCDENCNVKCDVSFSLQIELRNVAGKKVIENFNGVRMLTATGRGVYGHEQLHMQNYIQEARSLVDDIISKVVDGGTPKDCKAAATNAERELRKELSSFREARTPGGKGPDLTHNGPGQPRPGAPYDPQGELGVYVPS